VAKAIGLKITPWDGTAFLAFAPLLFLAGLLAPIVLKTRVLRLVPPLDRITR
jgi:hypothetical protein